jgi:hypothetical protein
MRIKKIITHRQKQSKRIRHIWHHSYVASPSDGDTVQLSCMRGSKWYKATQVVHIVVVDVSMQQAATIRK